MENNTEIQEEVRLDELKLGDVVSISYRKYVLVDVQRNEIPSNCTYRRSYHFNELNRVMCHNKMETPIEQFRQYDKTINVNGVSMGRILKYVNEAPFEFTVVRYMHTRRKTPKTITVYE